MGRIEKLIDFITTVRRGSSFRQVRGKAGGGEVRKATHFSAPGDDSFPLDTDYFAAVPVKGADNDAAVGYVDPNNAYTAQKGEKRIYGRNASGAQVNEVHLRGDGSILVQNDNASVVVSADGTITETNAGSITTKTPDGDVIIENNAGAVITMTSATIDLTAAGGVTVNGATFMPGGAAAMASANIGGSDYGTHYHNQDNDSNDDVEQPTGGPVND